MGVEITVTIVMMAIIGLIIIGTPIFLALGISAVCGILMIGGIKNLFMLPASMYGQLDSFLLVSVPLYIVMGEVLSKSDLGSEIYEWLEKILVRVPGGLAIASVFACAIFGAMCGVSIAGVAAIGIVAVPEMLKRGYNRSYAAGAVTSSGALAVLIPPSISFIIFGSIGGVSVGKLFIGGIIPGVILALSMSMYVLVRAIINPSIAPRLDIKYNMKDALFPLLKLWPVFLLLLSVLGTIYTGIATPTEAGGIGAGGALLITAIRGKLNKDVFLKILLESTRITGMIMIILAAAFIFSQFLNLARIPDNLSKYVITLQLDPIIIVLIIMLSFIFLGMFVDAVSLIVITTPVVLPTVVALGFDPIWYGILLVLNLEMAVITPPVGLNLYTMNSVIPELELGEILKGTMPYILVDLAVLLLFLFWQDLALWLPGFMN